MDRFPYFYYIIHDFNNIIHLIISMDLNVFCAPHDLLHKVIMFQK